MRLPVAIGFGFILGSMALAAANDYEHAKTAMPRMTFGDYIASRMDEAKGVIDSTASGHPRIGESSATWKRLLRAHPMLLPPSSKANSADCSDDSHQNYC